MVSRERLVCPLPGDRAFASGSSPPTLNTEKIVGGEEQKRRGKVLPPLKRENGECRGGSRSQGVFPPRPLCSGPAKARLWDPRVPPSAEKPALTPYHRRPSPAPFCTQPVGSTKSPDTGWV